jgi:hypothetical protein
MKTLKLRDLNNKYEKVNKGTRNEVYYDSINNNMIIFCPYDKESDTYSICDSIRESMYQYLINELNTQTGLIVCWSQVEGTTSDYIIYYDLDSSNYKESTHKDILKVLSECTNDRNTMKYNQVKDGKLIPIEDKKL